MTRTTTPTDAIPAGWVKADFHLHSAEDPMDDLDHTAIELLHRAQELGFKVIAITLHDHVLTQPEVFATARELGILLIPAAELRLEGADVVILNLTEEEAGTIRTLADLRAFRAARGHKVLTFAPHPFFCIGGSIGRRLRDHLDCFDALEYCHFHTRGFNLNRRAVQLARHAGKPLLATSDAHELELFGDHYSLVRASPEPTVQEIFASIRAGRLRQVSPPWPLAKFAGHAFRAVTEHPVRKFWQRFAR